jgi:hypothetical protein
VNPLGYLALPEDPDAEKSGLQEEGEQRLNRKRRSEDVPDEARILGPIHAKLEFLYDTRHHTDRKVDQEELSPKARHLAIIFVVGMVVARLHEGHEPSQSKRERDKQEVIYGRQPELNSRQQDRIHVPSSTCRGIQRSVRAIAPATRGHPQSNATPKHVLVNFISNWRRVGCAGSSAGRSRGLLSNLEVRQAIRNPRRVHLPQPFF